MASPRKAKQKRKKQPTTVAGRNEQAKLHKVAVKSFEQACKYSDKKLVPGDNRLRNHYINAEFQQFVSENVQLGQDEFYEKCQEEGYQLHGYNKEKDVWAFVGERDTKRGFKKRFTYAQKKWKDQNEKKPAAAKAVDGSTCNVVEKEKQLSSNRTESSSKAASMQSTSNMPEEACMQQSSAPGEVTNPCANEDEVQNSFCNYGSGWEEASIDIGLDRMLVETDEQGAAGMPNESAPAKGYQAATDESVGENSVGKPSPMMFNGDSASVDFDEETSPTSLAKKEVGMQGAIEIECSDQVLQYIRRLKNELNDKQYEVDRLTHKQYEANQLIMSYQDELRELERQIPISLFHNFQHIFQECTATQRTYVSNHAMTYDVLRIIKHYYAELGKKPAVIDLTCGEFGFIDPRLKEECHLVLADKFKHKNTNSKKYSTVEPLDELKENLSQRKSYKYFGNSRKIDVFFMDLPYETRTGFYKMGNCDLEKSSPFIDFNNRYGVPVKYTKAMILHMHIELFIWIKSVLPEGGWLILKTMRSPDFDLTHITETMLKENGFQDRGRMFFPSFESKKVKAINEKSGSGKSETETEIDPESRGSYMGAYRYVPTRRMITCGLSTKRLHQYMEEVEPVTLRDYRTEIGKLLEKCKCWKECSEIFYAALDENNEDFWEKCQNVFGSLGSNFTLVNNRIHWKIDTGVAVLDCVEGVGDLQKVYIEYGSHEQNHGNIAFLLFAQLLRERNGNNPELDNRLSVLQDAGITEAHTMRYFMNDSVERLFKNEAIMRKKCGV